MQLYDLRNSEIYTKYAWIHYSTVHTYHRVWLDVRMPTPAPTSLNGKSMTSHSLHDYFLRWDFINQPPVFWGDLNVHKVCPERANE